MKLWKLIAAGCLPAIAGCLLSACGVGAADAADDAKLWQGTWKLVSATENGQPQTGDLQWVVDGDHYNIRLNGVTHQDPYQITLHPAQKHIDVFHHEVPKGNYYGGSVKGIYEIRSDSLRVCYDLTGRAYPASFDAGPGSRRAIFEFRRDGPR